MQIIYRTILKSKLFVELFRPVVYCVHENRPGRLFGLMLASSAVGHP